MGQWNTGFSVKSKMPVTGCVGKPSIENTVSVPGLSYFIGYDSRGYYRPQRSWGKVIFSEACVKNSVHRGACMGGGHA